MKWGSLGTEKAPAVPHCLGSSRPGELVEGEVRPPPMSVMTTPTPSAVRLIDGWADGIRIPAHEHLPRLPCGGLSEQGRHIIKGPSGQVVGSRR